MKQLIQRLKHKMVKKNTKFKCALHVDIRITCSLYKLVHTSKYIHCSELFTIRKSIVHLILWNFIHVVNHVFKNQIRWAEGYHMLHIMEASSSLSSLLRIQGAIDVAQIHIYKLKVLGFVADYYFFKSNTYNMQLQVLINHHKHFLGVFIGMPGSTNHTQILNLSLIYQKVT